LTYVINVEINIFITTGECAFVLYQNQAVYHMLFSAILFILQVSICYFGLL